MSDFLKTVLPSTGRYCVFLGQSKQHRFFDTIPQLAQAIEELDTQVPSVYFALASFDDSEQRTASAAQFLRSIFIDLDCGPDKHYADHAAAVGALNQFLSVSKFPRPTYLVNSGGGVHAYWAMRDDIPVLDWAPVARTFKGLCLSGGLRIDPTVTADAARVLRPPGTTNRKIAGCDRPVELIYAGKPCDWDHFKAMCPAAEIDLNLAAYRAVRRHDALTDSLAGPQMNPSNFGRIVRRSLRGSSGCQQIRLAVTEAATLEEPLWRAALSIAWNCEDGSTAVHKLSKPHPEYSPAATLEKVKLLDGKPYTCGWYKNNYPEGCEGCRHTIGSPILLGRRVPEAQINEDGSYSIFSKLDEPTAPPESEMPPLPHGYFRGARGGIYRRVAGPDGEPTEVEIYCYDLYIEDRFFDSDDDGDGEGEQVAICLRLPQDGLRRFVAPLAALMAPDAARNLLTKHGVVAYGKQVNNIMAYLAAAIQRLQTSSASHRTRSQMGWTPERTFVVGNVEYTPTGPKLAPPASTVRHLAPWFHGKGTVSAWRDVISTYNTPGFEPLAFAFLVGAGSPLLHLLDAPQIKGGVVHLVSNMSGSGKTSAQLAVNSLFGVPNKMLLTEKDTFNSKMQAMGMFNSICVTIDEITKMQPEEASELVYSATTGRGKHRMEAQSNKLRVNHSSWCMFTLTSANTVLSDLLLSHKSAADGELKRLVELRVAKPHADVSREMVAKFNALEQNYGVAGPVFIQHIVSNYDSISTRLKVTHEEIIAKYRFDRTDRFYTAMLACAATAGAIMQALSLVQLDIPRILAYGIEVVRGSKVSAEVSTGSPSTMALETLAAFVADNFANTLVINSEAKNDGPISLPRGPLRVRYEPDTHELCIVSTVLRDYFTTRRVDMKSSLAEFRRMKVLKTNKNGDLSMPRRLAAGAQNVTLRGAPARCYVFDAAALGIQVLPEQGDNYSQGTP